MYVMLMFTAYPFTYSPQTSSFCGCRILCISCKFCACFHRYIDV